LAPEPDKKSPGPT